MKALIATTLLLVSGAILVACAPPAVPPDRGVDGGPAQHEPDAGPPDAGPEEQDAGVDAGRPHRVLFVGNSFTSVNDVPGHYRALATSFAAEVSVEAVTPGGYTWSQHWDQVRTDGTTHARWLRTGSLDERAFTAVVLQEQSQVGGFPVQSLARIDSVVAVTWLAALAHANGAAVVLYLTWGYERGDPTNRGLDYDTYAGMQDRLDDGYLSVAAALSEQGHEVRVAPVGGGFRIMFEEMVRAGQDPAAEGSDFDALYEADGVHPSVRGAYLAACIIAGTITSADVRGLADEPTLGAQVSARLRGLAAAALSDPRWQVPRVLRPQTVLEGEAPPPCPFGPWTCVGPGASGTSVALSADATRAFALGKVFERTDAGWEAGPRLPTSGAYGVLSADGTRALVASDTEAHVYQRTGTTWTEETTLAIDGGPDCEPLSRVPFLLAADGDRAVVGGARCRGAASALAPRVLVRTPGGWVEEAQVPAPQVMALDASGTRALVSADDGGAAQVLSRSGSTWSEEAALVSRARWFQPGSGTLSADGSRAFDGPWGNTLTMFGRSGTGWSEQANIRHLPRSGFGTSVSLSADGRRAAVGVPYDSTVVTRSASGSVKVYELEDGGYRQRFLLVPRDARANDDFGLSVAISGDGHTVLVGAPGAESYGAAYAYTLP